MSRKKALVKLYDITFSPTGGTKKVSSILTNALEEAFSTEAIEGDAEGAVSDKAYQIELVHLDLIDDAQDLGAVRLQDKDVAVISVPCYGGRVPAVAIERLSKLNGAGGRAVLICVYGNRAYDDALLELKDVVDQIGFRVIAAVAGVAEHSIARQFATGRPDGQDAAKLSDFANQIFHKLSVADVSEPTVPGNRPYKKAGRVGIVPKPTKDCNQCGQCARECPMQAIDNDDSGNVDKQACISCMRCISVCPRSARKASPVMCFVTGQMLKKECSKRKEPELYL